MGRAVTLNDGKIGLVYNATPDGEYDDESPHRVQ